MSTSQQNKEEEVDLGGLFSAIGYLFKGLIDFCVKIGMGIFHFIISCLLFFRGNLLKFAVATVIGAGIGAYYQLNKETTYAADMLVQPNFDSSRQLYNVISNYNNLLNEKDTVALAKAFNITVEQAASLRSFQVEPVKTDDDMIESYYNIVDAYDSVATMNYSFIEFKKSFTQYDYKYHRIHVESTDNRVFSELGDDMVSAVINNKYFEKIKLMNQENLFRQESVLKKDLKEVDTLRRVYMQAILEDAKKDNGGTNIDVGNTNRATSKEIQLFQTNRVINSDLNRVTKDITEQSEVINVVSDFQKAGYIVGGLRDNLILIYGIFGFLIMCAVLLILKLNKFLDAYQKS